MIDFYKKYWRTAFDIGLIALTVFLCMTLFSFLLDIATPIFIGLIIFLIIKPFSGFLEKKGVKKTLAVTISTFSFIVVLLTFFVVLGAVLTTQVQNIASTIPKYVDLFQDTFNNAINYGQEKYEALPEDTANTLKEKVGELLEKGSVIATGFIVALFGFLTSIPTAIFNFLLGLILAFFLALEFDTMSRLFQKKTPKTFKNAFNFLKDNVVKGIISFLKSQLILIGFTFVIVLIGFLIFGIKSAFALAVFAAFLDVLPLLGISTLFLPWVIYLFVVGQTALAIKLTILWAIVMAFRQIMEPKITGDSLGVSAFVMLAAMVISLSLFGVAGLILSPVILIVLKALVDQGYLQKWIHIPEGEIEESEIEETKETPAPPVQP